MSDSSNPNPVTGGNFTTGNNTQLSTSQTGVVNPMPGTTASFFPNARVLHGFQTINHGGGSEPQVGPGVRRGSLPNAEPPVPNFAQAVPPVPAPIPAPVLNAGATPALESGSEPAYIPMPDFGVGHSGLQELNSQSETGVEATLVEERPVLDVATGPVSPMPADGADSEDADDTYDLDQKLWKLADCLRYSSFLPPALRSVDRDNKAQKTADVYILLQKAKSYGFSPADAFDRFFVITGKDGMSRLGMYVQTKASVCARHGTWQISLDAQQAVARVVGHRYSGERSQVEVVYTGYDAALKGLMRQSTRTGCWEGVGKWADKWPEMLKTRALGRFLDQVFPDLVGGLASDVDDYETVELPKESAIAMAVKERLAAQTKGIN